MNGELSVLNIEGAVFYSVDLWRNGILNRYEENRVFETEENNFTIDILQPSHEYSISLQTIGINNLYSTSTDALKFITSKFYFNILCV